MNNFFVLKAASSSCRVIDLKVPNGTRGREVVKVGGASQNQWRTPIIPYGYERGATPGTVLCEQEVYPVCLVFFAGTKPIPYSDLIFIVFISRG